MRRVCKLAAFVNPGSTSWSFWKVRIINIAEINITSAIATWAITRMLRDL